MLLGHLRRTCYENRFVEQGRILTHCRLAGQDMFLGQERLFQQGSVIGQGRLVVYKKLLGYDTVGHVSNR